MTEQLRDGMLWWRNVLSARPAKKLRFGKDGGFARRPRLPSLHKQALLVGPDAAGAIYTDASSLRGWGEAFRDLCIQGEWSKLDRSGGVNWQVLRAVETALESWGDLLAGKFVVARMDNSTAAAYANYGAGRVPLLTQLARSIEELEARPSYCRPTQCRRGRPAPLRHPGPRPGSVSARGTAAQVSARSNRALRRD